MKDKNNPLGLPPMNVEKMRSWLGILAGGAFLGLPFFFKEEQRKRQEQEEHNKKVWGTSHMYQIAENDMLLVEAWFLKVCWAVMPGAHATTHKEWPCENDYEWQDIDWGYETRYD